MSTVPSSQLSLYIISFLILCFMLVSLVYRKPYLVGSHHGAWTTVHVACWMVFFSPSIYSSGVCSTEVMNLNEQRHRRSRAALPRLPGSQLCVLVGSKVSVYLDTHRCQSLFLPLLYLTILKEIEVCPCVCVCVCVCVQSLLLLSKNFSLSTYILST